MPEQRPSDTPYLTQDTETARNSSRYMSSRTNQSPNRHRGLGQSWRVWFYQHQCGVVRQVPGICDDWTRTTSLQSLWCSAAGDCSSSKQICRQHRWRQYFEELLNHHHGKSHTPVCHPHRDGRRDRVNEQSPPFIRWRRFGLKLHHAWTRFQTHLMQQKAIWQPRFKSLHFVSFPLFDYNVEQFRPSR